MNIENKKYKLKKEKVNALYVIPSNISLQEYVKFIKYVIKKRKDYHFANLFYLCGFSILLWLSIDLLFKRNPLWIAEFVLSITFITYGFLRSSIFFIKKQYEKEKEKSGFSVKSNLIFYEDYIESQGEKATLKVAYKDIRKVYESSTNIYIEIAKNQFFLILKDNCSKSFIEFLKTKTASVYIDKK